MCTLGALFNRLGGNERVLSTSRPPPPNVMCSLSFRWSPPGSLSTTWGSQPSWWREAPSSSAPMMSTELAASPHWRAATEVATASSSSSSPAASAAAAPTWIRARKPHPESAATAADCGEWWTAFEATVVTVRERKGRRRSMVLMMVGKLLLLLLLLFRATNRNPASLLLLLLLVNDDLAFWRIEIIPLRVRRRRYSGQVAQSALEQTIYFRIVYVHNFGGKVQLPVLQRGSSFSLFSPPVLKLPVLSSGARKIWRRLLHEVRGREAVLLMMLLLVIAGHLHVF